MITKYILDNGLSIILEPINSVVSISAGLWVKTGSRHENINQYGYAHCLEHMLFKGTKNYSARELARRIDRVGGQHNAATNREYTCYYINVVYDHLELAIEALADMYYNSTFDSNELEKEKNVIIEEIRMYEDTPDELIHDLFIENMFYGSSLSHSILGTIDSISNINRNGIVEFYDQHYSNDNTIFVIAGNFNEDKTKLLIEKYFSEKRISHNKKEIISEDPKRNDFLHIERDLEQVHFCLGLDGLQKDDENRWALYLYSTILGGSMSSRLFQNIRENEGISYSIYSFHSSYSDYGIFGIYCATSPETYERAIELTMRECRTLATNGVTKEELEDAKNFIIGNLALSLESIEVRMGQLAKNEISYNRHYPFNEIIDNIKNISLDDFRNIGDIIFFNKRFSLISIGKASHIEYNELDLLFNK